MPQLIRCIDHEWSSAPPDEISWQGVDQWTSGQALILQPDDEPVGEHAQACAIAINFPAFTDGRGLSLAVLLRTRLGFAGELRAVGAVHEEILHYIVRCGFTAIELPDERDIDTALTLLTPYADHYQASVVNPQPAFRRVNRSDSA